MLLTDKYRPRALSSFELHSDIARTLRDMVRTSDCPHVLFYGPPGAGKKTLVLALLREIYGPSVERVHVEQKPWKVELPSRNVEVELTTISSPYHVELNPSDAGQNDRYVVQEIIQSMARDRGVTSSGFLGDGGGGGRGGGEDAGPGTRRPPPYKVLVLDEVDRLSRDAQHSLRRTMERYAASCRLVLSCSSLSKVTDPIRSRCLCVRVRAPTLEEIAGRLREVAALEDTELPPAFADRLARASGRNLRRALLSLEAARTCAYPFASPADPDATQVPVPMLDWEAYLAEIADDVRAEQSPRSLYLARGKIYELLVNCVPPEAVLRGLALRLATRLDDRLKAGVAKSAALYAHRLQLGSKPIFHLEAFLARFMADYKAYLVAALA